MKILGIAVFLSFSHLVAGISLSVPTTNVAQFTTVDCQWTADATDPAQFALVMQFSNATSVFTQFAAVTAVQRGTTTSGTVANITNVQVLGMHRLAAYAAPFDPTSQPLALSPAFNVIAPTIVLSVPTNDVAASTSVNCQWTSGAADPATFSLVMQFSVNGDAQFADMVVVTVVQRGSATSGTVPNIKNVVNLGMHRLAAFPNPFNSNTPGQPWSVSPAFNVVSNPSQSSSTTGLVGTPTSSLPANGSSSSSPSTSSSRSSNHSTVIIAVVVVVVVLALVVLVLLLLMLRRRRQRKEAEMADIARPQSTFADDLGTSGTATYNAWAPPPPSDAARFTIGPVSPQREKRLRNGYLVPQRAWSDRRPSESNLNSNSNPPPSEAGSGSTWVAPGSDSDQAVSQRLQRQEAELEALRAEVRTLTQPPPSYE